MFAGEVPTVGGRQAWRVLSGPMPISFWPEFAILFVAALIGAAAVVPYSLRMTRGKPLKLSMPVVLLLALAQNAVLFGISIGLGLLAAHAVGLGLPYLEAMLAGTNIPPPTGLLAGLVTGVVAGAALLVADLLFEPYWPQPVRELTLNSTALENLLASLYGGIDEELLLRLFGLSGLVWLMSLVWHPSSSAPDPTVLWLANVVMTILFGLGHLPALAQMLGRLPPLMVVRSLLLNAPVGLACGWLFWTFGLEAAIVAHFAADIVYHVFGSWALRRWRR
jgi:hypothetical protein